MGLPGGAGAGGSRLHGRPRRQSISCVVGADDTAMPKATPTRAGPASISSGDIAISGPQPIDLPPADAGERFDDEQRRRRDRTRGPAAGRSPLTGAVVTAPCRRDLLKTDVVRRQRRRRSRRAPRRGRTPGGTRPRSTAPTHASSPAPRDRRGRSFPTDRRQTACPRDRTPGRTGRRGRSQTARSTVRRDAIHGSFEPARHVQIALGPDRHRGRIDDARRERLARAVGAHAENRHRHLLAARAAVGHVQIAVAIEDRVVDLMQSGRERGAATSTDADRLARATPSTRIQRPPRRRGPAGPARQCASGDA